MFPCIRPPLSSLSLLLTDQLECFILDVFRPVWGRQSGAAAVILEATVQISTSRALING